MLSIIVPVYNEERNLRPLYDRTTAALSDLGRPYEIICINDGSTDGSEEVLTAIAGEDDRVKLVNFPRNFGQTAALMAGFDFARGEVIVPMDADLQNDPADIGALIEKMAEGYSVVSGWRKERKDKAISRMLPSRLANWLVSRISGVRLHDYGCTLKAYDREVIKDIRLYGEMHRFIPIYASWHGARVTEVPVRHHPRAHGESKYGMSRIFKVLLDLIVVKFLEDYQTKPIYVFGVFGLACIFVACLSGLYALYLKVFQSVSFILTPLPLLVVMTFIVGVLSILLGLLAELLVRVYFESQGKPVYFVRSTVNLNEAE